MAAAADAEWSGSSDASRTGGSTARTAESQSAKSSMLGATRYFSTRLQIFCLYRAADCYAYYYASDGPGRLEPQLPAARAADREHKAHLLVLRHELGVRKPRSRRAYGALKARLRRY